MKNRRKIVRLAGLLVIFMIGSAAIFNYQAGNQGKHQPSSGPVSKTFLKFNTVINIKLYGDKEADKHILAIDQLLDRIDTQINMYNLISEINQINALAGKQTVQVSSETFHLVAQSLAYAHDTNGAFNPNVGALVKLWRIGDGGEHPPAEHLIEQAKTLVRYSDIELDENEMTIKLEKEGMSMDLGAIGKGYAADQIADYLRSEKVESALIDLGGSSILTIGSKPDGTAWQVGLQEPDKGPGEHIAIIPLQNNTIGTSGVYERYFVDNGIRYHHILDSNTGAPTTNGILSVTIIGGTATAGDALSTAAIVKGLEEGMSYIENTPDMEAIFIMEDNKVHVTSGLLGKIKLTNPNYTLASMNS
ncbi:FAD:protein FMN transferase [Paenibacillus sp. 1001270B_150601_E10]|uniref:FAD:protein FMN transferase n=1 Tax=Paenibacillus sp. 1001270B_150601_E10 TaxID=2787079 RepID=UPI001E54D818|nr:FAD:protein FMN transferase [Paenibacillus sp. 1001270B_150601_E10]